MLYNIFKMDWDPDLLKLWNVPAKMLPKVLDNSTDFGEASYFPGHVHIYGVAGDQQAALFGQCCYKEGDSKNTYGTGCFMLMNIGNKPFISKQGLTHHGRLARKWRDDLRLRRLRLHRGSGGAVAPR
jgi:glycerol kinase